MNNDKQLHDARIALANVLNNMSDNEIAEWFGGTEYAAMADTKSGMRMIHAIASAALENIAAPLVVKANADTASNTANTPAFGPNQARYEQCAKPKINKETWQRCCGSELISTRRYRHDASNQHQTPDPHPPKRMGSPRKFLQNIRYWRQSTGQQSRDPRC